MLLKENTINDKVTHKTELDIKKVGNSLFFSFYAEDSSFYTVGEKYNDNLYDGDVVEIFITYGLANHYYEIEVSPNGLVFLADIENINGKTKINFIDKSFVKTKVEIIDNNYKVEISLPLNKIKTERPLFNAFRIERMNNKQYLYALNPTMCHSFHKMEYFIDLLPLL